MISPRDVRIGNYVLYNDQHVVRVVRIGGGDFVGLAHKNLFVESNFCQPIELSTEWLERFKFDRHQDHEKVIELYTLKISTTADLVWNHDHINIMNKEDESVSMDFEEVKYVHQLQNLCYTLTGIELTINEFEL